MAKKKKFLKEKPTVDKSAENASKVTATDEIATAAPGAKREVKYAFPNASQCPRCRTYNTVATSTKGNKQYRKCRRCIGGWNYCVTGVPVEPAGKKVV